MNTEFFEVQASSRRYSPYVGGNRQIIFHGINKSGSLVLSNVLRAGYQAAGREEEFHSHYHQTVGSVKQLVELADQERAGGFFVAHYLWGALKASPERIYITQFRHPLPRVVSCYQWLKNKHERARRRDVALPAFPSLEDYVKNSAGKAHSQSLQFAAGFGANGREVGRKLNAKQLLPLAKDAIHRDVHALGLAERIEESIFMFAYLCGLPQVPAWVRDDRNKNRQLVNELSAEQVDLIQEVYESEFLLYQWVVERFQEQLAQFDFGPSLQRYKATCEKEYKDRLL